LLPDATQYCSVYGMLAASVSKLGPNYFRRHNLSLLLKKKLSLLRHRSTRFCANKQMFTPKRAVLIIEFPTCALGAGGAGNGKRSPPKFERAASWSVHVSIGSTTSAPPRRPLSPVLPISPALFFSACSRRSPARPVPSCRAGTAGTI